MVHREPQRMSIFSDIAERVRALLFVAREERELDEELRTHIEMEAEYRRQGGATPASALRESTMALGGLERTKEDVRDARGTRGLHDIWRDVGFAIRTLRNNPGFTLVTLATLAVGIGSTTAVYSAVDAVLVQPLPYSEPGQLVRLYQHRDDRPAERGVVSPVYFVEFRQRTSALAHSAAVNLYSESGADIGSADRVRRIRTLATTVDYFDVVRVHPALGRGFVADEEMIGADKVVLSDALWKEQMNGDPNAVGRTMMLNGRATTVIGVMPPGYEDPIAGKVDALVPLDLTPARDPSNSGNFYLTMISRLRPGTSIERAQAEINAVNLDLGQKYDAKRMRATLYSLKETVIGTSNRALTIMLGAVILVLVLVCVNVANLMLVRGSDRAHELAVRTALGAERWRLVRQMLIESLTLAIAGAIGGLVVARLAMSAIVALGANTIPRLNTLTLAPRLLAFSFAVATLSAVAFGLAPAVRASRTRPTDAMRNQGRASTGGVANVRLREWLVISQVALAFMLMVGSGLLISSLSRLQQVDLGIKSANVLTFELNLPESRYDSTARALAYERVARELAALPGVRAAGGVTRLPATGQFNSWFARPMSGPLNGNEEAGVGNENRVIAGNYFAAAGIPIVRGRAFDERDAPGGPPTAIITQSLADKIFPGTDAIGQVLRTGGRRATVVGVVGETAVNNEGAKAVFVYHPHAQFASDRNWTLVQLVAFDGSTDVMQSAVRSAIARIDPLLVVHRPMLLEEAIGRGAAQRVFTLRMLGAFAAIALVLSALGIFGVLSYVVRMRKREFGIRMALGAQPSSIRVMVLRRGLIVGGVGIVFGVLSAAALSQFMRSMLFEVSPLNPFVFAVSGVFMVAVALLSAYLPARNATTASAASVLQ